MNPDAPIRAEIRQHLSPVKEGYNALINTLTNDGGAKKLYVQESTQYSGKDNGFFAQPGEMNANGTSSITKVGGVRVQPVTFADSNSQSKYNHNGMPGGKTGEYIQQSKSASKPRVRFNDIYSRKKGCDKKGQLKCAVENMENAYAIQTYTVDEQNRQSPNTAMYSGQNPKTLIPPMVTRPMYSLDWRNNSLAVPNRINGASNENLHLSGYLSSADISNWEDEDRMRGVALHRDVDGDVIENFSPQESSSTKTAFRDRPIDQKIMNPRGNPRDYIVENYNINNPDRVEYKEKDWSDAVNMSSGYNTGQFQKNDFPNNLPQGNCGQNEKLKEYNDRLFTTTVQPGTYYKHDVAEQINSNAGISFQQQFLPRTIKEVPGGTLYEDHDPENCPVLPAIFEKVEPNIDNVYDPRFNGYGDQTRNYVDDVTGQPRFVYDDINNVKMPNYITRNKLDTFNFGSRYGIAEPHGKSLNDIRGLAESAFLNDSTAHRDDMTVKLMRKTNAAVWQRRQAPIRTNLR